MQHKAQRCDTSQVFLTSCRGWTGRSAPWTGAPETLSTPAAPGRWEQRHQNNLLLFLFHLHFRSQTHPRRVAHPGQRQRTHGLHFENKLKERTKRERFRNIFYMAHKLPISSADGNIPPTGSSRHMVTCKRQYFGLSLEVSDFFLLYIIQWIITLCGALGIILQPEAERTAWIVPTLRSVWPTFLLTRQSWGQWTRQLAKARQHKETPIL